MPRPSAPTGTRHDAGPKATVAAPPAAPAGNPTAPPDHPLHNDRPMAGAATTTAPTPNDAGTRTAATTAALTSDYDDPASASPDTTVLAPDDPASASRGMAVLAPDDPASASRGMAVVALDYDDRLGAVRPAALAGLVWAAVAGVAVVVGSLTVRSWPEAGLRAAPLYGHWDWQLGLAAVPATLLGGLVVAYGPTVTSRLPWKRLVPLAGAATVAWSVALAATDGWARVTAPLGNKHDYLQVVDRIAGPGDFLRTYTDRLVDYPIHVKGHPPGMPLLLWALDRAGFGGTGWAAAVVLAGAGLATAATLVTLRAVAGEAAARRAAPFVAIAPAALWLGTTADALFAGVGILGCACLVAGRRSAVHVAGGLLLGATLHFTYGAVVLLAIPAVVAAWRRDLRPLLWAAGGITTVGTAFALAGFWWFDGLDATRHFYEIGVASDRPYPVFTGIVNPGVVALATGPAAVAGLWWLARLRTSGALGALPRAADQLSRATSGAPANRTTSGAPANRTTSGAPANRTTSGAPSEGTGGPSDTLHDTPSLRPGWLPGVRIGNGGGLHREAGSWAALAVLPLAGLVALVVANLSGMSKGEVERIWQPFYPWLLTATAALPRRHVRAWLAAQVALALLLEMSLRSAW